MNNENTHINKTKIILILGALTTLVPFSVDTYLPAMSRIADYYGTDPANMSFSLTTFFIGFAIGQLIYGPLLDRYGRKKPLYVGMVISILGAAGCIIAWDETVFIGFRFIEALGASVATVAAITMVRDFFSQEESAKVFSLLVLIIGSSPLLAPTVGGTIIADLSWQWIFVFLSLLAVFLILLTIFVLPVKHQPNKEVSLKIKHQSRTYLTILKNNQFATYALAGAFSFATLFVYVAGSPIIFMEVYGVSPQAFGGIFAMLSVGFIGGSQLNILVLRKFTSKQIFRLALASQMTVGLVFLLGSINNWYDQTSTLVMFFLLLLSLGFTSPNAMALALEPFDKNLGSASALMGTIRIGVAGLASGSIGLFNAVNSVPVTMMITGTTLIAIVIYLAGNRKRVLQPG